MCHQARIWELYHQQEVIQAETEMSDAYELAYPSDTARAAMEVIENPRNYGPEVLAQASVWMKLNPKQVRQDSSGEINAMTLLFVDHP